MYNKYNNSCAFCGENSGRYELCGECYNLSKEEYIIKTDNGEWIKNVKKGNEYKFYDSSKHYSLKENLLNENEMKFFNAVRNSIHHKYVIIPQVNLQTIVETDTNTRNDELFRNIDFIIYHTEKFIPFLAIELNGQQHYTNPYWKERDNSVKSILKDIGLPLLTIDVKDLRKMDEQYIQKTINKVIKYLNPGFLAKIFKKKNDKMDLSWVEEEIKKLG